MSAHMLSLLGIDRHALFGAYGMRRALLAAVLIVTTHASVFSEGGPVGDLYRKELYDYPQSNDVYFDGTDMDEPIQKYQREEPLRNARESQDYKELEEILRELKQQKEKEEALAGQENVEITLKNPEVLPTKKNTSKQSGKEKLMQADVAQQPLVAQKKGQNEFVSFVEPVDSKQTKSVATLEKRRLAGASEFSNALPTYSSNLLMIAVGTVLIVGMVASVLGGGYYIKRRRSSPDDSEYAPYAGTGPGFKKNKGDKGDESLAYKAQLHQYQQAKQKIICGEDAPAGLESDAEDEGADDENNFSVYECPGLAPTGDIEVCNPNFAAHP
ncbi:unnamed protein product [Cylicocyclus nassatus]|uniref:Uncharacterized protein n=1 Tax=Cylicocyclus nassatus TaxID=53992 RepID=A0AA36MHR7_CYLNA|nr:unnamed protein product [Cylicocyclus nassatus]